MLRSVTYDQTRRFVVWAVATLVAAYVAGLVSGKLFDTMK